MKDDKFKQFCHFLVGAILLPTAFKLFHQKKFSLSVTFLVAGVLFLFVSATLEFLEKKMGNILKLIFLLESLVLVFASYIQLNANKRVYALAFLGLAIVYFLLFVYYLYNKHKRRRHHKKRHHKHGSKRKHVSSSLNPNEESSQ